MPPDELIKKIEGKVWTFSCFPDQLDKWINRFSVSNASIINGKYVLKIVSDQKPVDEAVNIQPNLEDVYLYYFGETYDTI